MSLLMARYNITSDFFILDTVSGLSLQFDGPHPTTSSTMVQPRFSSNEHKLVALEIDRLLSKGVIVESQNKIGEFISPIFVTPKADGGFRLILNLKKLNEHMPYIHFKMDTIDKFLKLIRRDMFMAKVDLKDAYYSVKINKNHQKFLKFYFNGTLFMFTCLPNGLCSGPRKFTKLLKPPLSHLRTEELMLISAYIDDIDHCSQKFSRLFSKCIEYHSPFFISRVHYPPSQIRPDT